MNDALTLIGIASALAIGAMSPGPSFVMVARTAVASSRSDGFHAALLGLQTLLIAVPWLYLSIKVLGGAYLAYLGFRILRGAKEPLAVPDGDGAPPAKAARSFLLGLGTQISNPKTAIVYASVFAALLPREVPLSVMLVLPFVVLLVEAGWYAVVALVLSSASPRAAYLRYKAWIDRVAGGVMLLLGLKLAASAREL